MVRPFLGTPHLQQVLKTAGQAVSEDGARSQQQKASSYKAHKDHVPQGQDLVPDSEAHPRAEGKSGSPESVCHFGVDIILLSTLMATVSPAGRPTLEA